MTIAHRKNARAIGASQKEIRVTILVQVSGSSTTPITNCRQTNLTGHVAKRAVSLVAKKRRGFAVTDNEQIDVTPVVEICGDDCHHVSEFIYLCRRRDIRKLAVPVIAQQHVWRRIEIVWENRLLEFWSLCEIDKSADKKIQ